LSCGLEQFDYEYVRDGTKVEVRWRFTTADARIELRRIYPAVQCYYGLSDLGAGDRDKPPPTRHVSTQDLRRLQGFARFSTSKL
jgi:hypothetical protein